MSVIGSATLNIVPKVEGGLANAINGELKSANVSGIGKATGKGFMGGFASGASIGIWSTVASKAIGAVTSSLDSAAGRVDTLNNFPRIMQTLGVSASDASASMHVMSTSLDNVPTRLDDMASTVQGIYAATMKYGVGLGTVTDAGLALNSMLLAGGQSQAVVNAAMEQFRQMVAKGKPDMQDWRSLISAAPGQMEQLAKSMLDAEATADDLYAALGGGKEGEYAGPYEWGSISMGEFVEKFSKMRSEFEGAAQDAQSGIGTSLSNMKNAVTKGVAGIMEAFGQERIASAIGDVKTGIKSVFGALQSTAEDMSGPITRLWDTLTEGAAAAAPTVASAWKVVSDSMVSAVDFASDSAKNVFDIFRYGLQDSVDGQNKISAFQDALKAVSGDAEATAGPLQAMAQTFEHAMDQARASTESARDAHEQYLDTLGRASEAVRAADDAHEAEAAGLELAAATIDTYAGKTSLTASEQRELKSAIDKVNEACGTQYGVVEGSSTVIDAETGKIQENTQEIWNNVRAREAASRADALGTSKMEVDKGRDASLVDYQAQKKAAQDAADAWQLVLDKYGSYEAAMREVSAGMNAGNRTIAQKDAFEAWQLWTNAARGMQEADVAQRQLAQTSSELSAEQEALYKVAEGGKLSISDLALSSGVAATSFNDSKLSILDFADALEAGLGKASVKDLRDRLADPSIMAEVVAAYDGTAQSLEGVFEGMGVGWDEAAAKALDAQGTITEMGDWISGLGEESYQAMALMGMSSDELAGKLKDSGVTMEQLRGVGEESFGSLLSTCQGDFAAMGAAIQAYNSQPVVDKDGRVHIEDASLIDAQGNVYTWNGTALVDQNGKAAADDHELVDAYGNVIRWNGTDAKVIYANIHNNSNPIPSLIGWLDAFRSRDGMTVNTTVTNTTRNVTINEVRTEHSGGVVMTRSGTMATGGHVTPRHASGYIAAGPTRTNFGLVGEDGIEAVYNNDDGSSDVYPLTNPRYLHYADPLGKRIADSIVGAMGDMGPRITAYVTANGTDGESLAGSIVDRLDLIMRARGH